MSLEQQTSVCDALRDLVAFVQFKKGTKHPWRSVKFEPFKFEPFNKRQRHKMVKHT